MVNSSAVVWDFHGENMVNQVTRHLHINFAIKSPHCLHAICIIATYYGDKIFFSAKMQEKLQVGLVHD